MPVGIKRAETRARYYIRDEARRLGWDVRHPTEGGSFLEEREIVEFFPALRHVLTDGRPDFAVVDSSGKLRMVIECKNDIAKLSTSVQAAIDYAAAINKQKGFDVPVAVGVAGTPDKYVQTRCKYRNKSRWLALTSHGYELTQLPTAGELSQAIRRNDGTTEVQLPDEREFFDAAIQISQIFRDAKIEDAVRPVIIGAIILALYQGDVSLEPSKTIELINLNVKTAIDSFPDFETARRNFLIKTLKLSTESHAVRTRMSEIVHQLERLNIRSIMRSGVDFLGQFYEAFLHYGGNARGLGIVFTPRHITRYCAELLNIQAGMKVYDPACGTGGFLVAAFDRMMSSATTAKAKEQIKKSIFGRDTNPTVWALAVLNMFFRGDGKSHIDYRSCFEEQVPDNAFHRVLLNPPYSQATEHETEFINHALDKLDASGELAVVVKTGIAVDSTLKAWRQSLVANHHILAVISLPGELFQPMAAAPAVIIIIRAHTPDASLGTFLAKIHNDGFELRKSRRVPVPGSQLAEIGALYQKFRTEGGIRTIPGVACVVSRDDIKDGGEVCAEDWLPSAKFDRVQFEIHRRFLVKQISQAIARWPELADELIVGYDDYLGAAASAGRPKSRTTLDQWFEVTSATTTKAATFPNGSVPYISSGEQFNSITEDFKQPPEDEIYDTPYITVTGFGMARIQPWRFCARGGAGSCVRLLKPRFAMTLSEMIWFAGQINAEQWRIYYGRMVNIARLKRYEVDPPPANLPAMSDLEGRLRFLKEELERFSDLPSDRDSVES